MSMANENNQDRNRQDKDNNLIDSENKNSSQTSGQRDDEARDMSDTDES